MNDERRAYTRLTLTQPLDGWFGDFAVRLVDVSASGAQIEHDEPIPDDARALLRFWFRRREVEILAETARIIQEDRSGLRFLEESDVLRSLITESAAEVLRAFEANASGDRAANVIGDETLTSAWSRPIRGFVCWIYEEGRWRGEPSAEPHQPENGFTIAASEADEEVEMLRRTYESGDEESRKLTRILAEMSVGSA